MASHNKQKTIETSLNKDLNKTGNVGSKNNQKKQSGREFIKSNYGTLADKKGSQKNLAIIKNNS